MKSESQNRDQQVSGEYVPGLVHTARHTMGVDRSRSGRSNRKGDGRHGVVDDWGEVVTR